MAVDTLFILQLPFIFVCVLLCISYKPLNAQAKRRCPAQLPPGLLNRASLTSHALEATIHGFKLVKTPPYPLTRARRPTISRRVSYLYYILYVIYTPHALEASYALKLIKTPPDLLNRASLAFLALEAFTIRLLASQNSAKLYRRTSVTVKTL